MSGNESLNEKLFIAGIVAIPLYYLIVMGHVYNSTSKPELEAKNKKRKELAKKLLEENNLLREELGLELMTIRASWEAIDNKISRRNCFKMGSERRLELFLLVTTTILFMAAYKHLFADGTGAQTQTNAANDAFITTYVVLTLRDLSTRRENIRKHMNRSFRDWWRAPYLFHKPKPNTEFYVIPDLSRKLDDVIEDIQTALTDLTASSAHEESKEGIRLWNELGRTRMEFENLALEIACAAKHVSEEFVKTEEAAVACNDTLQTAQGMIDALAILSSQTRQDEWKNQLDTAVTAAQEMVRLSTIVNEYAKQIEARPANAYTTVSEMDSPPPQHVPNSDDAGEAMPLLLHEPRHSRVI